MIDSLTRNWWVQLIRGLLALALGVTALVAPSTSLTLAVVLVAAFAIGDGAMTITTGIGIRDDSRPRGILTATGAAFTVLGLVVLFWPSLPEEALVLLFALWLVASGALLVYGAWALRRAVTNAWITGALGVIVMIVGLVLALFGPSTVDNFLPFAGWFGVVVGLIMIAVSFRLRRDASELPAPRATGEA